MNNDEMRRHLDLAADMTAASERHLEISQDYAAQALEIRKHVEASFGAQDAESDGTDEMDRPPSLQVMPRLPTPSFPRLAAAVAEGIERVESDDLRRRRPITDSGVLVIRTPPRDEKQGFWTRIANWWWERSSERRLPVGW